MDPRIDLSWTPYRPRMDPVSTSDGTRIDLGWIPYRPRMDPVSIRMDTRGVPVIEGTSGEKRDYVLHLNHYYFFLRYRLRPRSIQGPSEVDTGFIRGRYGVHLRSIRGPSEVDTGSIRGRYGVHLKSLRGPSEVDTGSIRSQFFS